MKSQKLLGDPDRAAFKNRALAGEPRLRNREGKRVRSSLAVEEYLDRAYPAKAVLPAWKQGAQTAFAQIRNRGAGGAGSWQLAGPSTATYPSVLNRTNSDYVASGRVSAMAIDSTCATGHCRVWVGAAGGGIWRTDDALASNPSWTFISGAFGTNAIGSLTYDAGSHTLYAGTGEPNASADSEAGVGIYKSTDGGNSWSLLPGSPAISIDNSVASIAADPNNPNTVYVGTTLGIRGIAGVGGGASLHPGALPGLYKTTDGGNTFSLVYDDSPVAFTIGWGVNHVAVDASHNTVYLSAFSEGIKRSTDGGASWEQVFATQDTVANGGDDFGRTEFALATQTNGHTRIYVGDGGTEVFDKDGNQALTPDGASFLSTTGVYRGDDIDTKTSAQLTDGTTNPGFTTLSTFDRTKPGYLLYDYCWAQCWYDNFVISPAGSPDTVYVLGAYNYDFPARNNGRTVLLSNDAGAHWYDQTADRTAGDGTQHGIHPDQHAIVVNPSNPLQFFEGSDGGVVRSSGQLTDGSDVCDHRGISPTSPSLIACRNALAQIPTHIDSLNAGLPTLQFQNIAVNPANVTDIMGGTQDNGTWEGTAGNQSWPQTMYGDGGIAQFDVGNPAFRMNEFFSQYTDVNFRSGDPTAWAVVSGPFFASGEPSAFYKPQLADPVKSGTFFVGLASVWRTQDFGGSQAHLEADCPEFTTPGNQPDCGDFVPLGDPGGKGGPASPSDLTASGVFGTDKTGGYVVALGRGSGDTSTLWAATRRGRVFISKNADGAAGSVSFTRLDDDAPTPRRFVSGIVVDPKDPNHAFISFGGYNAATDGVSPPVAGHVFDVQYDPKSGKSTWSSLDRGNGPLGDLPINALALDAKTNRLYAGTDFGVVVSVGKSGAWRPAASGLPLAAVSGLTLDSKNRVLYAATHGRAIWSLQLNGN